jgi:hypothetical protein
MAAPHDARAGKKDRRIPQLKVAAIVVTGLIVSTAPAAAALISPVGKRFGQSNAVVEQIRYCSSDVPEALIGGIINLRSAGWDGWWQLLFQ